MKFRVYVMLAAGLLWFGFGFVFLYRSAWTLADAKHHRGVATVFGVQEKNSSVRKNHFTFHLTGMEDTMGIIRRKYIDYEPYRALMQSGDSIDLYYEQWRHTKGKVNFQIVQLESRGKILIDHKLRKKRDLYAGTLLSIVSIIFFTLAWRSKRSQAQKDKSDRNEFHGLGVY